MGNGDVVEMPKAQLQTSRDISGGLVPRNLEELWRMGGMFVASGMMPDGMEKQEAACVAIQMGLEVGLSPMQAVQNIAVINGRPSIWGDAALGLVMSSGKLEEFNEYFEADDSDGTVAVCEAKRAGKKDTIVRRFSMADAKQAQLLGKPGPWQQYPKRMLQMRARSWALRDGFADVLKGLQTREEVFDMREEPDGSYTVKQASLDDALKDTEGNGDGGLRAPEPDQSPTEPEKSSETSDGEASRGEEEDETEGGKYVLWPLVKKLKKNYPDAIWKAIKTGKIKEATEADLVEMRAKWDRQVGDGLPFPPDNPPEDFNPGSEPAPKANGNSTTVVCPEMDGNAVVVSYCNHTGQYADEGKGCKKRKGCPVWADEDAGGDDEKF